MNIVSNNPQSTSLHINPTLILPPTTENFHIQVPLTLTHPQGPFSHCVQHLETQAVGHRCNPSSGPGL